MQPAGVPRTGNPALEAYLDEREARLVTLVAEEADHRQNKTIQAVAEAAAVQASAMTVNQIAHQAGIPSLTGAQSVSSSSPTTDEAAQIRAAARQREIQDKKAAMRVHGR